MERLTIQVTFETEIMVDVPEGFYSEEELFSKGMAMADGLRPIISVDHTKMRGGQRKWDKVRAEVMSEGKFIGDYMY